MRRTWGRRIAWSGGLLTAGALLAVSPLVGQEAGASTGPHITSPYRWVARPLRVGLFGGRLLTSRGTDGLGPGSTLFGGAAFRARVSGPLSIEVRAAYGRSDLAVIDPTLSGGPAPVDTTSTRWVLLEGGMQFSITGQRTWHRLQPYLVLLGGMLRGFDKIESTALSASTDATFRYSLGTMPVLQGGAGFEWQPTDRIGVSLEARDLLMHIKAPPGFFRIDVLAQIAQLGLPAPQASQWTHNLGLTLTVWRYF